MRFADCGLVDLVRILKLLLLNLLDEELLLIEHLLIPLLLLQHHLHLDELRVEAVLFLGISEDWHLGVSVLTLSVGGLVFDTHLLRGRSRMFGRTLRSLRVTIFSLLLS